MKKIIIALITVSALSFAFADEATSTIILPSAPKTGDVKIDEQIKGLIQERNTKIKAINDEYQVKIKAIIDGRKILMASTTLKLKEGKDLGGKLKGTSTIDRLKEKLKGEVKGAATTTIGERKGLFDFFSGFFKN
ncbi:MAG: hypothetical protein JWN37_231 [Candidatus Nomurabacteria bacterium]|nr:hypothetical protein [Candidatus Nomurabacteria bacterium]